MATLSVGLHAHFLDRLTNDEDGMVGRLRAAYDAMSDGERLRIDELFGEIPLGDRHKAAYELMRYFLELVRSEIAPERSFALATRLFDAVGGNNIKVIKKDDVAELPYGMATLFAFMLTMYHK